MKYFYYEINAHFKGECGHPLLHGKKAMSNWGGCFSTTFTHYCLPYPACRVQSYTPSGLKEMLGNEKYL